MNVIMEQALKLYDSKIATGLYKDYPIAALEMLFNDCVQQTAFMMCLKGDR